MGRKQQYEYKTLPVQEVSKCYSSGLLDVTSYRDQRKQNKLLAISRYTNWKNILIIQANPKQWQCTKVVRTLLLGNLNKSTEVLAVPIHLTFSKNYTLCTGDGQGRSHTTIWIKVICLDIKKAQSKQLGNRKLSIRMRHRRLINKGHKDFSPSSYLTLYHTFKLSYCISTKV